ncbi:hypothetical protein [Pseudolabrys sp.]
MTTVVLIVVSLLMWFIWKQLERIANELVALRKIAEDRQKIYRR